MTRFDIVIHTTPYHDYLQKPHTDFKGIFSDASMIKFYHKDSKVYQIFEGCQNLRIFEGKSVVSHCINIQHYSKTYMTK